MGAKEDLTIYIKAARDGDRRAHDALFEAIYGELKRIAASVPRVGRAGDTMQPTVLAHEFWAQVAQRFPGAPKEIQESRATFFRSVALAMRTILRDHHRAQVAAKRGGGRLRVAFDDAGGPEGDPPDSLEFLALDRAMEELERYNARWYEVVLQRFFAGRTIEQTSEILGVAPSTVIADWKLARGWLKRHLSESGDGTADRGPA